MSYEFDLIGWKAFAALCAFGFLAAYGAVSMIVDFAWVLL